MDKDLEKKLVEKIKADTKDFYNKTAAEKTPEIKTAEPAEFEKNGVKFVRVGNLWVKYEN